MWSKKKSKVIFLDDVAHVYHHVHTITLHLCYRLGLRMIALSSYMRRSERRSLQNTTSLTRQLCPTVLKLLLDIYFHRLWSWRKALTNEYIELFPGVNVSLCSDWSFAERIVVLRAIVAPSENSVTSYSMQSRAGRTWCIRSKNSTDISAIRVCRYELSQVSTEIHSCNHEFAQWVSSPSRLEARTWQHCLSLDWVSRDTENNVPWHHPVVRGDLQLVREVHVETGQWRLAS